MLLHAMLSLCGFAIIAAVVEPSNGQTTQPSPRVEVIGVYEGQRPPGVRQGGDDRPQGEVAVSVTGDQPIILVVTAYEPVAWKVDDPNHFVTQVIASGHYKQTLHGLDERVNVTSFAFDAGDNDTYLYASRREPAPDARPQEAQETTASYDRLVDRVRAVTGSEISSFQGRYRGSKFVVPARHPLDPAKLAASRVEVIGVYEGLLPNGEKRLAREHPRGRVSVHVTDAGPMTLVLTSQEPVLWDVDDPHHAVIQVIAAGDYQIEGLDTAVPVSGISMENGDDAFYIARCREARPDALEHERKEEMERFARLSARVRALTGKEMDGFQGEYYGNEFSVPMK